MFRFAALFVAAVLLPLRAHSTSFSTDETDLWWNPNESGWGANIIQQQNVLVITFFIYGSNGQPTWYIGPDTEYTGSIGGGLQFSGKLYQTSGPWFGGSFDPHAVGVREVGTVTFNAQNFNAATMNYTADSVFVSKSIVRQTWRTENLAGNYLGATIGTYSGCPSSGYSEEPAAFLVTQNGNSVVITGVGTNGVTCTYSATYTQMGRMGYMNGNISCSNGAVGTFVATEVTVSLDALVGFATVSYGGSCSWSGRFGGLKRGA